jgi:uncharacterized protein (TIGR00106 family)
MIVEFSIVPVGRGEELAGLVAKVLDVVDRSGLPYQLTSMGTIVEGNWDDVMGLIKDCHRPCGGGRPRSDPHLDRRRRDRPANEPQIKAVERFSAVPQEVAGPL